MNRQQKEELIGRVEEEYGVARLFKQLGMKEVSESGKHIYAVCPFHAGADNPNGFCYTNGFGYCFTQCNRRYDLFDIVMKMQSCSFPEAVAYLGKLVGMDTDRVFRQAENWGGHENQDFVSRLRRIRKKLVRPTLEPLDDSIMEQFVPALHTILREEGFDNETRDYFDLRFAPDGYMQNRIIIPIDAPDGSIISLSGRSVDGSLPRYKIWHGTDKSLTLYNISRAQMFIELTGEVILVEGFKSVWRLQQWGYGNAVAVMGASLSEEQRRLLLQLNCKILVCGDRDEAGRLFNQQVYNKCFRFADVEVLDMYVLNVPETSSVDNISLEQFRYLYDSRKARC